MMGEEKNCWNNVLEREKAPWASGGWLARCWDSSTSNNTDLQFFI